MIRTLSKYNVSVNVMVSNVDESELPPLDDTVIYLSLQRGISY
jgi:hypothetical protein